MNSNTHFYLFGGGPPFTPKLAEAFSKQAHRPVCTFLVMNRPGWEEYRPIYAKKLEANGLICQFLPLGATAIEGVTDQLAQSGAIVIGGGNTERYIDEIVETAIGEKIKECFLKGVPVAGFSAGALLSMEDSLLSPKDNASSKLMKRRGLGLVKNTAFAVHFSEWNEEEHLRNLASNYSKKHNYGVDEQTGLYLMNGMPMKVEGRGVYTVIHNQIKKREVWSHG